MTDRPRSPETGDDNTAAYEREPTTGIPRWVKVSGIIVIVLVLLVVVLMLTGVLGGGDGGGHGPSRHGAGPGGQTSAFGVTDVNHVALAGAR